MEDFYVQSLQQKVPVAETEVVTRDITATVHGEEVIVADTKVRIYSATGEEVYDEALAKRQGRAFLNQYATRHGLITTTRIIEIRDKFGFTQAGFANLLGINKKVYQSYEEGVLPTPADSDLIKKVAFQDISFLQQLYASSDVKSYSPGDQQRLRELLSYTLEVPKYKRAADVVNWFFAQYFIEQYFTSKEHKFGPELDERVLARLLYMAQGIFFAQAETYLFEENTLADDGGPYYESIRNLYHSLTEDADEMSFSMVNLLIEDQHEINGDPAIAGVLSYVWAQYRDETLEKVNNTLVDGINQWQAMCYATSQEGTKTFSVPNPLVIAAIDFDGAIEDYYDFDGLYLSMQVEDEDQNNLKDDAKSKDNEAQNDARKTELLDDDAFDLNILRKLIDEDNDFPDENQDDN